MTPEQDLIYKIVETWGNAAISFQEREQWLKDYAQQQAIEFDKWKKENGWQFLDGGYVKLKWMGESGIIQNKKTADNLYSQFIESQQTNNQ